VPYVELWDKEYKALVDQDAKEAWLSKKASDAKSVRDVSIVLLSGDY
jgi:hypothetical protein